MNIPKKGSLCFMLILGVAGILFALAGCGQAAEPEPEPQMSAEATAVSYEPSGAYTTTLTPREGVSLADLTAADFQVGYQIPDMEAMETEESGSMDDSADASTNSDASAAGDASTGDEAADASSDSADAASSDDASKAGDTSATTAASEESAAEKSTLQLASAPSDASESDSSSGDTSGDTSQDAASNGDASSDTSQDASSSGDGNDSGEGSQLVIPTKVVDATVKEFTLGEDGTATLSFEDADAATNRPRVYSVYAKKSDFTTQVAVDYPVFTLTPDVPYVPATSEATKLTLTLTDGGFAQEVTKDDIELSGSFEGMDIESLSSAGKNLTVQLTGAPQKTESSGVYLDGSVGVAPNAIQHASETTWVSVPVHVDGASFVVSGLKVNDDGTVSVPLTIYGDDDLSKVTAQDVTLSGGNTTITVRDAKATSESELALTLSVPDINSANEAAKALNGRTVSVAGRTFTAEFPEASFYPVFDFVEDAGDNLAITLIAYASGGTFVTDPAASDVTLSDEFSGGTVTSVERTGDTTAEIKLTVPANGQHAESLNLTGTVTLAAGTLQNAWGEPTSEAVSNTRSYSQESLGRNLGLPDLTTVNNFVKSIQDSGILDALKVLSSAGSAANGVKTLLTVTGVIPDANEQLKEALAQINGQLGTIQGMIATQTGLMQDISKTLYEDRVAKFDGMLKTLSSDNSLLERYFAKAATLNVPQPDEANESLAPTSDNSNPYAGLSMEEQSKLYGTLLIQAMIDADKPGGACDGFGKAMDALVRDYSAVADAVASTSTYNNPIYNFDYLCSQTYNFDTIALPYREAYRSDIEVQLSKAIANIYLRYNVLADPTGAQVGEATQKFDDATNALEQQAVQTNDNVYFYIPGIYVYRDLKAADDKLLNKFRQNWWNWDSIVDPFATEAIRYYGNLDETQMNDFMKRLNGRTASEELELAQFTNLDYCKNLVIDDLGIIDRHYNRDTIQTSGGNTYGSKTLKNLGLSLNLRYQYEDRGSFRYGYKHFWADYIPWDESKLVKDFERMRGDEPGTNIFLSNPGYDLQNGTTTSLVKVS